MADQTSEAEFLNVNHCIIAEDEFGFVTKDFVNLQRMKYSSLTVNYITQTQRVSHSYLES